MNTTSELIAAARGIIALRFRQDHHHVGAALRTQAVRIYCAVHVEAYVGRVAVCAEAIAIGMAAADGDTDIEAIVAVDRAGNVVAPCGMCRELISDYSPRALVVVGEEESAPILELLPRKYNRNPESVSGFDA